LFRIFEQQKEEGIVPLFFFTFVSTFVPSLSTVSRATAAYTCLRQYHYAILTATVSILSREMLSKASQRTSYDALVLHIQIRDE
jgi:hypothetical protein